jgi:hypothetical protein
MYKVILQGSGVTIAGAGEKVAPMTAEEAEARAKQYDEDAKRLGIQARAQVAPLAA